ncbi:MAG TPA: hypothetical protein VH308_01185 [Terracidiphilus sp.]|jgi:hypothetical protein|nr:hypothetical protein [Terracidiphilus sp.]
MNRPILFAYQLLTGFSDTTTGALLLVVPELTLRMMHLSAPPEALIYISFIGAFVLSVGLSCIYGAFLVYRGGGRARLEVIWLLTALTRASVAIFVAGQIMAGALEAGWLTVAAVDGACVLIQAMGLRNGWLSDAEG